MQQAVVASPASPHRTETVIPPPEGATPGTCGMPERETALTESQAPHSSRPLPRREGPEEAALPKGMVGLRALDHMARPSDARGDMQHSYAHGVFLLLGPHGSLLSQSLPCPLSFPSLAPPGATFYSRRTFSLFFILLCLTTWACLLLGFFLSRHLGLGGSFTVAPQEGLTELLGIRMLSPVFLRRAHCSPA